MTKNNTKITLFDIIKKIMMSHTLHLNLDWFTGYNSHMQMPTQSLKQARVHVQQ